MNWESQELNYATEGKFPEVEIAGLWLLGEGTPKLGHFEHMDQARLDEMVQSGALTPRARGVRIDRLCLHFRLVYKLGPGGDHYPVLGVMHFWDASQSRYAIFHISPRNDWFNLIVVDAEAPPNPTLQATAAAQRG